MNEKLLRDATRMIDHHGAKPFLRAMRDVCEDRGTFPGTPSALKGNYLRAARAIGDAVRKVDV